MARRTTFTEYYESYATRQIWTPQTARAVDLAARTFPSRDMPLRDLRPTHIESWIRSVSDAGLRAGTIRTRVANVRAVLAGAQRDGYTTGNPVTGVRLPRLVGRARVLRLPTRAQVESLVTAAPAPYDLMFALCAYAGLRLGEARALTWADVDLNAGVLHIRHQLQQLPGGGWAQTAPKYGSYRSVPIVPPLHGLLREAETEELRFVVEGAHGGPVHPGSVHRQWSEQREAHGLAPDLRVHDLRHVYASTLIANGDNVLTVQRRLGHARASTTLDVYAHALGDAY